MQYTNPSERFFQIQCSINILMQHLLKKMYKTLCLDAEIVTRNDDMAGPLHSGLKTASAVAASTTKSVTKTVGSVLMGSQYRNAKMRNPKNLLR